MFYIVIILTCYGGDKWERKGSSRTVIILCQADKGSVLVSLCQHDINSSRFGGGNLNLKRFSSDCPVGKPVVRFLDQWLTGEGQVHYGQCHSWSFVVLSVLRKAEHTRRSRPVSSVSPTALHQHPLLSGSRGRTAVWSVSKLKPFLSKSLSVLVFYHSNRNPKTVFKGNT